MQTTYVEHSWSLPSWMAAVPLGLATTFLILLAMVNLVGADLSEPISDAPVVIDYPVFQPTLIETRKDPEMVEKPQVTETPKLPEPEETDPGDSVVSVPTLETTIKRRHGGPALSFDGLPVPQLLVKARYPNRAILRQIEGYVDVLFDITAIGSTTNVRVTQSQPQGVFEKSAITAVKRWRYRPKIVSGEAVPFVGMRQRISFDISD